MTLAANVKRLREAKGLSQTALAKATGISQQLVSQIEGGTNTTTKFIPAMAKALGVTVDQLDPAFASTEQDDNLSELSSLFVEMDEEGRNALLVAARAMRPRKP